MAVHPSLSCALDEYLIWAEMHRLDVDMPGPWELFLKLFQSWCSNVSIDQIRPSTLRDFYTFLMTREEYRFGTPQRGIELDAVKALAVWTIVSEFWNWVAVEYGLSDSFEVHNSIPGTFEVIPVSPLTEEEIHAVVNSLVQSQEHSVAFDFTAKVERQRNLAIFLLTLSTGMCADEICRLNFGDVSEWFDEITVTRKDRAKRSFALDRAVSKVLGKHMVVRIRQDDPKPGDPMFVVGNDRQRITPDVVDEILKEIGQTVKVEEVSVKRLRHMFALTFLAMGGLASELEHLLGHQNADTYIELRGLEIDKDEIREAHRKASPVRNWRLDGLF